MSLDVSGICQSYGSIDVLKDVSVSLERGETVTVLGPNGSGKSTLIRTICGILKPKSGSIKIDGCDIGDMDQRELSRKVGYVPQSYPSDPHVTVFESVLLGRAPYMSWSYSEKDFEMAAEAIDLMGISDMMDRRIGSLSGGQRQKVAVARAVAQNPEYLILDEPISALDIKNQYGVIKSLRSIIDNKGAGVLMSMHHIGPAIRNSDRILLLKGGCVYGFGPADEVVTERSIGEVYGLDVELVDGRNGKYLHVCGEYSGGRCKDDPDVILDSVCE